jgi:serine/threonine-protein kinase
MTLSSDPQYWQRVQNLFDAALYMPSAARESYLRDSCGDDAQLLHDIKSLLDADDKVGKSGAWDKLSFAPSAIHELADGGKNFESGYRIGPYEVLEEIGSGGMGVVYKAFDTRLERIVAIKCLSSHIKLNEQARQRFMTEARAASRIDHPNICAIHDIGETEEGIPYIVMSYYEGKDLRQTMGGREIPVDSALDIGGQICDALSAAHSHDVLHRDIKPANVLLTTTGDVKILDFGIAKMAGIEQTGTGMSVGTVAYMSPEQIKGEEVDARADIWSLGVIMYEAMTGRHPFSGNQSHELMYSVLNTHPLPISSHFQSDTHVLDNLTRRMLAHNPKDRYENTSLLREDITQASIAISRKSLPVLRAAGSSSSPAEATHTAWDEGSLTNISHELIEKLGPIAPVLIKKYSKQTHSLDDLVEKLSSHLETENERATFVKKICGTDHTVGYRDLNTDCPQTTNVSTTIDNSACVQKVESVLLPLIGPVAKSMIKRAQCRNSGCKHLCDEIADLLVDEDDKKAFLAKTKSLCH